MSTELRCEGFVPAGKHRRQIDRVLSRSHFLKEELLGSKEIRRSGKSQVEV